MTVSAPRAADEEIQSVTQICHDPAADLQAPGSGSRLLVWPKSHAAPEPVAYIRGMYFSQWCNPPARGRRPRRGAEQRRGGCATGFGRHFPGPRAAQRAPAAARVGLRTPPFPEPPRTTPKGSLPPAMAAWAEGRSTLGLVAFSNTSLHRLGADRDPCLACTASPDARPTRQTPGQSRGGSVNPALCLSERNR